jgi:hypothetical protein
MDQASRHEVSAERAEVEISATVAESIHYPFE